MDQRMIERIKENLPQLIELTSCSAKFLTIFLSKSILSKTDIQLIKAEETKEGQFAASSRFYDLLTSRLGSSDVLLEALSETTQTGALDLLTLSLENECANKKNDPLKFSSNPPKYIMDYINQQNENYIIVSSDDCKLTCDRILESKSNCKLCSITEVMNAVSSSPKSLDKHTILLSNLNKNLDPIYTIEQNFQHKFVFVIAYNAVQLQEKLSDSSSVWKIVQDKIEWRDLISHSRFRITSGLKLNLGLDGKELADALKSVDSKILVNLLNDKFPTPKDLFCQTIPHPISYYVTRSLKTRYVISNTIFEEELYRDLVLLSGIERFLLSEICPKILIESSSSVLRNKKPTSQFVFLDNEIDFEIISNSFPNYAVHLLEYDGGEFIWKKSNRNVFIIRKHVAAKQRTLVESEFVSKILAQTTLCPICIFDTPGKGKSELLTKIAHEVKKLNQTDLVTFIKIKNQPDFG